jgi:hypothetical protein
MKKELANIRIRARKNLIRTTNHPPGVLAEVNRRRTQTKRVDRAVALLRDLAPEEGRGFSLNPQILRSGSIATLRVTFTTTPIRVRSNAGKRNRARLLSVYIVEARSNSIGER